MNTERIVIHGCSGSGKSTLAERLTEGTGLPRIELDSIFHQPGWTTLTDAEFAFRVQEALAHAERTRGGWIVDGNYDGSLHGLVRDRATIVLWFDLPKWRVITRITARTLRRAVTQEELWNGNRERWTNLFRWDPEQSIIRWAWTRHHVYRERLRLEAAEDHPQQRWICLTSQQDADRVVSEFTC
jgi:adenylate kinase family enzyme